MMDSFPKMINNLNMISLNEICRLFKESDSFIITTHKYCDGDGLGSGFGLYHALKILGKKVRNDK